MDTSITIPDRYNKENFLQAVDNPSIILDEIKRIVQIPTRIQQKIRFTRKFGAGIDVMDQDWDNLIILDACRYDIFEEISTIEGDLSAVISKGSHSLEFCNTNFSGQEYHDTVYVTANGYGAQIGEGVFHDLIFTDETDAVDMDVLHSSAQGMAPSTVHKAALDTLKNYPNKRVIIHFMQPHDPYFGQYAEKLRERVEDDGMVIRARDPKKVEKHDVTDDNVVPSLAGAAKEGYISHAELRDVYVENLELALGYVCDLVEEMEGKTIITADHGEYLGENGIIGHPKYTYAEVLRKVPWLVIESDTRPTITRESPTQTKSISDDVVAERLKDLGYMD